VAPADQSGSVTIAWDNSSIVVPAGTVLDIPPGSALEAAYGLANLTPLSVRRSPTTRRATAARQRTTARRLAWR
jgi:hypothetical protein